ncbi:hypothetical protein COCON_G00164210 [Conger conger]|uniref:Uncharacterized protein n=1 Tax=Conger conger TaxID=82655 RepID=A0A9Q1D6P8_CONCO|nr:hypothetical protein COCON_G00164210 [Conger conger]
MGHTQEMSLLQVLSLSESSTMRRHLQPSAPESVQRDATQSTTVWVEEATSLKGHHSSVGTLLHLAGADMEPTKDGVLPWT